ncbi:MAG: C1 family peptidase [Mucilaginibacter sp.]
MTPRKISRYGWIPDLPDHRDIKYSAVRPTLTQLPPMIDLRDQCPPVYDQGQIGSCTANAIGGAFEFGLRKQGLSDFMPARLFIYYNERAMEGDVGTDGGAQIRDGVKSAATQGVCNETQWPYDPNRLFTKPTDACYQAALSNLVEQYISLDNTDINQLKSCLSAGNPFVFGFTVYQNFESATVAQTGILPMPAPDESAIGGHAVLAVGYDDSKNAFIVRNSWGTEWGLAGYFYMPYAYITSVDLASDFWVIQLVE